MTTLVVDNPEEWPLDVPDVEVVSATEYLLSPEWANRRRLKVYNLCRSYRYQSTGYYVSLLAEARRHRPLPSVYTIEELKSAAVIRALSEELEHLIEKSLKSLRSDSFELSIYFGENVAQRYARLSRQLFNQFQAPFLRARFSRGKGHWNLNRVSAISTRDIPDSHREFVVEAARRYFDRTRARPKPKRPARFELAILVDHKDPTPPSDAAAIRRFVKAGQSAGLAVEIIGRDAYARLRQFDALFIRATTNVSHFSFRFAQRAKREGLVVIDDPDSIIRCSNKVYLAELLARAGLPTPKTRVLSRSQSAEAGIELGFPLVLKKPDSQFSQGVVRVAAERELAPALQRLYESSDLVVAQQYMPTDFDWRVGVIDGRALFVCRYFMAPDHWQIVKYGQGQVQEGRVETLAVEDAPSELITLAERSTAMIGSGFYGVDIKQSGGRYVIIEINDNPSIEAGFEDRVLKQSLYDRVIGVFVSRLEARADAR